MPLTTVTHSGRLQSPHLAQSLMRRENATPAMPWTTVTASGRVQRPPFCAPTMLPKICHACYALDDRQG
eukprot:1254237-Pyramimonas_sp.AAC.1